MNNTVKDRSGQGLPPKAERRALGKAAARKRQQQRRRHEILSRLAQIAAPIAVVLIIVGAIWFWGGRSDDGLTSTASPDVTSDGTAPVEQPTTPDYPIPAGLETKPVVVAGEGGPLTELKVTTLVAGAGAPLANGQSVTVNYVGVSYATGEEFDTSWNRGQPLTFDLGAGGVIQGWDQGLVGVPIGSRVQLDIPVALAYQNTPGYPEGDLRFVVDVLGAQ